MPHSLIDGDSGTHMMEDHPLVKVFGVGEQNFIGACLNQHRRKTVKIAVQRRDQRILKIFARSIIQNRPGQIFLRKYGVNLTFGFMGFAASC